MVRAGVLWVMLLLALPGHGREVDGLYRAEVPVKGQGREERLAAYPGALAQVVIKLTGSRQAPQSPPLAKVMAAPQNLVQQYLYQEQDSLLLKDQGYTHKLVVIFDERALERAVVAAGVPLWGRTRPDLLLWLALEEGSSRTQLGAGGGGELASAVAADARRRGLPLLLPALDQEDQRRLAFADIWGNFRQPIMDASKRYGANAVLAGRVNRANGRWQGRWSLYQGDDAQHWVAEGGQRDEVVAAGVDGAADRLAQRYAQRMTAESAGRVPLTVVQVAGLDGYGRVLQYLQSLDLVTRVQVNRLQGDALGLEVEVRGDASGLERAIALGSTLRRADGGAGGDSPLAYQLVP